MKKWFFSLWIITFIGFVLLFFNFTHEEMVEFDEELSKVFIANEFVRFFHHIWRTILDCISDSVVSTFSTIST